MLGFAAGFVQHGEYIFERLNRLAGEVVGLKLRLFVPADLACNEYVGAGCRDAVCITAWLDPAGGKKCFFYERCASLNSGWGANIASALAMSVGMSIERPLSSDVVTSTCFARKRTSPLQ